MYATNAIESLNNCYKKLNKGRRIFLTIQTLEKKHVFIDKNNN